MHGNFCEGGIGSGLEEPSGVSGRCVGMSSIGGKMKEGECLRDEVGCTPLFQLHVYLTLYDIFGSQC